MASVLPSVVDEALFQCRLCCCRATDPRLLPCLHVFCRTCLLRHVDRLRAAATAQQQSKVAENEPQNQLEPGAEDQSAGVEDGLPACTDDQPSVTATGPDVPPTLTAKSSLRDAFEYEVPCTDDYDDVNPGDQMYANDAIASTSHIVAESRHGYVMMASRPVTSAAPSSTPQVRNISYRIPITVISIIMVSS